MSTLTTPTTRRRLQPSRSSTASSRRIAASPSGFSAMTTRSRSYEIALTPARPPRRAGTARDRSDPRYDDFAEVKARWRKDHPDATGNDPNIAQIYALRTNMEVGSLVVISDGNR